MPATTQAGAGRADDPSALVVIVDGLIDRAQRSPLMRRAPAQCSPEEQVALAQILADLSALRSMRSAVDALPALRVEQVGALWPELGTVLATRRAGRTKPREGGPAVEGGPGPDGTSQLDLLVETAPPQSEPAGDAEPAVIPTATADLAHLLLEALTVQGRALNSTQMLGWLESRGVTVAREQVMDALYRHENLFRRRGASQWVVASQE